MHLSRIRCICAGWLVLSIGGLPACSPSTYFAAYNDPLDSADTDPRSPSSVRAQGATLDLPRWSRAGCWPGQEVDIARDQPSVIPAADIAGPETVGPICAANQLERNANFVGLALSGGGARAAVFSAAVLFELQAIGVLDRVDVLSAVSGGALTAALYAISCDVDDLACERTVPSADGLLTRSKTRPEWREDEVFEKLSRSYIAKWIVNRLWPDNVVRSLLTSYDSTDVFAETLSDNLYDTSGLGGLPFTFGDLNPDRPSLILSSTDYSQDSTETDIFTFTKEDFESILHSDLTTFELGRAVAASSAYPGFFNYSTLAVWHADTEEPRYKHLFDGGASDNLAIAGIERSLKRTLLPDRPVPDKLVFIVVDAQNGFAGISTDEPDPRDTLLGIVDFNFLDAYDTLMERNYAYTMDYLPERLKYHLEIPIDLDDVHIEHIGLLTLNRQWFGYPGTLGSRRSLGLPPILTSTSDYVDRQPKDPAQIEKSLLWREIKRIDTGYGLSEKDQACLRASAYLLVHDKAPQFITLLSLPVPSRMSMEARRADFLQQYKTCLPQIS